MRFGVLGPLAVWTANGDLVVVPDAKVRLLLAELLVEPGRVVSADRLIEDLWGDGLPARPLSALQTLVSRLRKALASAGGRELVAHRPPGYLLEVTGGAVDAEQFISLADQARRLADPRGRADRFAQALSQWRGPAFAGFEDEPFARAAVTRLEEQRLLAWEEFAEVRLQLGDHGRLAGELQELSDRHPLRERLREAHMRALYGAGRPGEALDVYQDVRRRLDEELGLEPGPALVALQQEILRQDPAALRPAPVTGPGPGTESLGPRAESLGPRGDAARSRTNLPAPVTPLIGRSSAVAEVGALLAVERLVTLTGPGGVGKTRLALEAASESAESFADGVWLVELSGLARSTKAESAEPGPAEASGAAWTVDGPAEVVAAALGIRDDAWAGAWSAARIQPLAERLADALRGRRLLLVLDNCEHVVETVAGLTQLLLRAAPGVRILTTSREPLGVSGEQLWPVPPLDVPLPGAESADVLRSSAVRLFAARAAAAAPGFTMSDDNAEAVATICRRMDGIPLALELASTRVRVLGAARLAERLDDRFGLLTDGRRDAPARQQTLRSVIDWSWELLTAAEQAVLRRLAIHSDGCDLEAAETLCPGGGVKTGEVVDLLARLVDRSLVVVVQHADGPRYRLLESVAAYCQDRLRAATGGAARAAGTDSNDRAVSSEYDRLRSAHASYYVALAETADIHLRGGDQQRWLRRLDAESANIRASLDTAAADGDARLAGRLVRAMAWYWFLRGRFTEARRSMSEALTVEERPGADLGGGREGSDRAALAAWHAGMTLLCGDRTSSKGESRSPLRLYEDIHDSRDRAGAGWFLGYAATLFGAMEVGEELVRRSLDEFRAAGDCWGIAAALSVRGVQRYVRGELAASRADGETSLSLFRETGDRWGQLQATGVLGRLAEIEGDYRAAEAGHQEALGIAEDLGLWTEVSTRWSELGRIALLTGDHVRAEGLHERGRRVAVEHGDRRAQEFAETGLALGARRQGRLDVAEAYLRTWLEWNRQFDAENGAALILAELGFIAEQQGDAEAALDLHTEGLNAARSTGDPRAIALALEGLAGVWQLAGRPELAAGLLGTATRSRASVGAPLPPAERGDVSRITAAVRNAMGDADFAAAFARDAEIP
ncbi:BTAD domain-containing putative transcriptional regulator [Streptomyces sp. NPDC060209]|uniref:AfsR/SARP family transcriptional regulator n=1 Tax=Streptomyces sp. NPDC060209 TaxID=3347073 RepID=UPI003666714A